MRVSDLMGWALWLAVALAAVSTTAFAFQEQQSGAGAAATQAPAATPGAAAPAAKSDKDLGLTTPSPAEAGATAGTEVRIPGLGKLGVLPKMDFGLELLYGANEAKAPEVIERENPATDDLTIRGTVKHNF